MADSSRYVTTDDGLAQPVPVLTTGESQATPPASSNDDAPGQAPSSGGVGAGTSANSYDSRGSDNTPPPNSNTTQQAINQTFANQPITAQPNVLDRYSSYTYAVSWWLLTPEQYNSSQTGLAPAPNTGNWTLLCQSGGAPVGQRNPSFPFDFYIDDLEIETYLMGKGTNMSTNAADIRFKVVEPNGLSLIQRLYEAVVNAYKNTSPVSNNTTTNSNPTVNTNATRVAPNYAAAIYALTIEFYGYDSQGNLISPARGQYTINGQIGNSNNQAVIRKYYPFLIQNITFRTVANQIEYMVQGKPVPYSTGTSQARGTIPFAFSLAGQTVAQLLQGSPVPANSNTDRGARTSTPAPAQGGQPAANPGASVNDIRASAGVDANGNFTGETASPFSVVAP
jgi:hypothetical protein